MSPVRVRPAGPGAAEVGAGAALGVPAAGAHTRRTARRASLSVAERSEMERGDRGAPPGTTSHSPERGGKGPGVKAGGFLQREAPG